MITIRGHDITAISYFKNGTERVITTISKGSREVWSTLTNIWKSSSVWKASNTWKY